MLSQSVAGTFKIFKDGIDSRYLMVEPGRCVFRHDIDINAGDQARVMDASEGCNTGRIAATDDAIGSGFSTKQAGNQVACSILIAI